MNTQIKHRTDTYANWEAANNNTPGGLKVLQGSICVIIADAISAAAGLSNPIADLVTPFTHRLANTGEVLGTKVGQGFEVRWDQIPTNYHVPEVNFANGTGRVLGTRNNGATHVYKHPGEMFKAIFGPVYSAPLVNINLRDGNNNTIHGALLKVGQVVPNSNVAVYPQARTYRVKSGIAYEFTNGQRQQIGLEETAAAPNTIGNFVRSLGNLSLTPGNSEYNASAGTYSRSFYSEILDDKPGSEGGNNLVASGTVRVFATFPTFFGATDEQMPGDELSRGIFLTDNCTEMLRTRTRYDAGKVAYRNGAKPVLAYPAAWGPLRQILDELGLNQLGYDGAAFSGPLMALHSQEGLFENVPYFIYTPDGSGYNADLLFSFLF